MTQHASSTRRWIIWGLRAVVVVLVGLAVVGTFRRAVDDLARYEWQVHPGWLFVAGVLYLAGLVPMAWFWHRTLAAMGQPAPWSAVLRAYFLGHLGKYVPGKAMAVILRMAAVRQWVPSIRISMVSALLETLTMMAVGAFWAAVFAVTLLELELRFSLLAIVMAIAVGLPTLPPIMRWLARFGAKRMAKGNDDLGNNENAGAKPTSGDIEFRGINLKLLVSGWIAASVCWVFLGLSLWATLRALGSDNIDPIAELPLMIATVAFAVVAGFASMLPGGLGVRDAVLMRLLAPVCGAAGALVAAVILRLVWLVSEVGACVILYIVAKLSRKNVSEAAPDGH